MKSMLDRFSKEGEVLIKKSVIRLKGLIREQEDV